VLDDLEWNFLDVALNFSVGELSSDETLGGEEGIFRVDDRLPLGSNTDQTFTFLGEGDDGWSCAST